MILGLGLFALFLLFVASFSLAIGDHERIEDDDNDV